MVPKEKKLFNYDVYEDTGNEDIRHFGVKITIDDKVIAKRQEQHLRKKQRKKSQSVFFCVSKSN